MTKKPVLARDLMQRDVITVPQTMDVWELARLFTERAITGAPVVDAQGDVVGVVSQADIVGHLKEVARSSLSGSTFYAEPERDFERPKHRMVTAMDLMTAHVVSAPAEATVDELSQIMLGHRIHRILITKGKKLLGIVTTMDMLKVM